MHYPQILACDVTGRPHSWLKWQAAVIAKVKGTISYEIGDPDIIARGGISRMTGQRSHVDVAPIVILRERYKPALNIPLNNHNLFARDLFTCGYCGNKFREDKLSRDHIIPRVQGGKDIWTNVICACKACNNYKDDQTPEEADMPLLFLPYVPNFAEHLILKNRNILADQMAFIQPFLPAQSRLL